MARKSDDTNAASDSVATDPAAGPQTDRNAAAALAGIDQAEILGFAFDPASAPADRLIVTTVAGRKIRIKRNSGVRFIEALRAAGEDEAETETLINGGGFVEAIAGGSKGAFLIRVIRGGLSANGNYYPDAALREALPLFNGARVFVKSDKAHLAGEGKDVSNLIGGLGNAAYVEGAAGAPGEVQAVLTLIEPDGRIGRMLREALSRKLTHLFGFSIDAQGELAVVTHGGRVVREAQRLTRLRSVDLIVEPGAGGQVLAFIEALAAPGPAGDPVRPVALPRAQDAPRRETVLPPRGSDGPAVTPAEMREAIDEAVRQGGARAYAAGAIAAANLPDQAKAKLRARFGATTRFTEAEVDAAIIEERVYIGSLVESGRVTGLGGVSRIEIGEGRSAKIAAMWDAYFDPSHRDHRHAQSLRECYVETTGDRRVSGLLRDCDQTSFREAIAAGDFASVLGDSITRRLVADYRMASQYDVWRRLTGAPVPLNDFRQQKRTRFGGYGDVPTVAEQGPYLEMAPPTDEEATYAPAKRGGTLAVTLEMIKNDDVGAVRQLPVKASRAAKRTLAKFILDFLRTNPTIYDSVALFHATHGNLGSTALAANALSAARLLMLKQTEKNSGDPLGIGPTTLWVPPDLQETAVNLFNRTTNNDKTFQQENALTVAMVWYWTDVTDWCLSADPMDVPQIELGFVDGREEPELLVQDAANAGSLFANDTITYKLRHIYGAAVVDYRGLFKAVVAG